MALITWEDSFSVNMKEIDDQHKIIIKLINDLDDARLENRDKEVVIKIIVGLANYTLTHFATEETYFQKYGYSDTQAHNKEHRDFIKQVVEFKTGYDLGRAQLTTEILEFLRNWLRDHILGSDQKYVEFFGECGLH
ncbi:hemerythrin family protein [Myxococcota bacterium]|nr:hemerythrin family protein [Myxococcota bacterium]